MYVYLHMPFCLSHCIYCDFYVALKATDDRRRAYLEALKQEITGCLSGPENEPIETVYFGGGTPALFSASEIAEILEHLRVYAPFSPDAEITLEANPEGMTSPPQDYLHVGINRISVGVQSLQPNELKRLSRIHSQKQVYRFISDLKAAGFENISIDLMYGIPEQTLESWEDTLNQAISLDVSHISMYGLKVEIGTGLYKLIENGRMKLPLDDETVEMYFLGISMLESYGYEPYEISNLAKPGFESRHNLAYWDNESFWGFGVSAHGYMDNQRYENPRDLQAYLENPGARVVVYPCSEQEKLENAFIFGLRKRSGVSISKLEALYNFDFHQQYGPLLSRYLEAGYLSLENNILKLAPKAIPVSNEILLVFIQ